MRYAVGIVIPTRIITMKRINFIVDSSMRIDVNAQESGDTTYIDAVKRFLEIYLTRFFSVFNRYEFFFQFAPEYKQYRKDIEYLQSFTRNVIEQRKRERTSNPVKEETDEFGRRNRKKVFLDIMLDSNQMTDQEIREEVDTFMFGVIDSNKLYVRSYMYICYFRDMIRFLRRYHSGFLN